MIETIQELLGNAVAKLTTDFDKEILVERSRHSEHGHYSSNVAMLMAKLLRKAPTKIAEELIAQMDDLPADFAKVEVKAPGFINFFLSTTALQNVLGRILSEGQNYGRAQTGQGQKALVEFVSANPTGPLTVGHGRQAILGDSIARILEYNGYDVDREYYYNDAGRQMRILGHSTFIRYRQALGFADEFPDDYYQGAYIQDIAREIMEEHGDKFVDQPDHEIFTKSAEKAVFTDIEKTLLELGIRFTRGARRQL